VVWTPVGARVLDGPLARYYLPLVPFVLLLSSERVRAWGGVRTRAWLLPLVMLLFLAGVLTTPWVAARRFYNAGPEVVLKTALR
jgi:uncharacterized membrane protein